MITKNDIHRSLSKAGIKHSDKLTVYASLRSDGKIKNGADERLGLPERLREEGFVITIKDHNGNTLHTHYTAAANTCVSEYYPNHKAAFEYTGAVTYGQLGNALVYVCDAVKMTDTVKMPWGRTDHDPCIKAAPVPKEYYTE